MVTMKGNESNESNRARCEDREAANSVGNNRQCTRTSRPRPGALSPRTTEQNSYMHTLVTTRLHVQTHINTVPPSRSLNLLLAPHPSSLVLALCLSAHSISVSWWVGLSVSRAPAIHSPLTPPWRSWITAFMTFTTCVEPLISALASLIPQAERIRWTEWGT